MSSTGETGGEKEHTETTPSTEPQQAGSSQTLDALLSPSGTPQPETQSFPRDSVASVAESEFADVGLDDSRFSTVALTARDSTIAIKSPVDETPPSRFGEDGRRTTIALGQPSATPRKTTFTHKKSASATSARSANNVAFFMQRLDVQMGEKDKDEQGRRISVDGKQKLQEEFNRKQSELEDAGGGGINWEFWGQVVSDEQTIRLLLRKMQMILRALLSVSAAHSCDLRSASKDPEMEAQYLKLIKETSPHEKAITRDLGRTFPHHAFFTDGQGIGQENLFNVLKAYSIYDPQVGYCQGLPFIVAVLLLNMPDEEAFCLLVRLMHSYDLRGHFLPEMPKLQLRMFQFDRLIEDLLPVLNVHFLRQGIKSSMFCSQWFLTLFSYRFPLDIVFRIFDNCLASGIEAIFGFSLILLQKNEGQLLKLKFDELVSFLNNKLLDTYKMENSASEGSKSSYRVDDIVQDANSMRITPFMLDAYTHEYNDMIRARDAHAVEMDALRSSNRNLSQQVNLLETSMAQLNQEHVNILNELVMARSQNEELEGELVRYKFLAALGGERTSVRRSRPWLAGSAALLLVSGAGWAAYENYQPFRHTALAVVRCSRIAEAAVLGAIDYKRTFAQTYASEKEQLEAYSQCHSRSARRVLKALLANGGVFIKLGQHMASLIVLPPEWTSTMRPLQDQCVPTPYEDVEKLFVAELGLPLSDIFDDFNPEPVGVASLAQVHVGHHRESGKTVAVKLQHPHLDEFCEIDMEMVEVTLGWIKRWFPDFEFTWLGEEMRENLPKEMNFVYEARNAQRATEDFKGIRTSLYIPEVVSATKRVLIMEYIEGARVDDLVYLADHNIDRNKVSLELARIFSQMVYINGWFHADPHPGNLLIRPRPAVSKSPYNFEIVLLDHGLYFDLDTPLRINYCKLWLALIASASPQTNADRRKYAQLVGNVSPELFPVFEAALTGRAHMEDTAELTADEATAFTRATSMLDMVPQSEKEMEAIRNAVVTREGLLLSVFDVLRRVPRRVLMVFKLNDLTRSLDHALATTHAKIRVFLIMAKYCAVAVWQDDRRRLIDEMREKGLFSPSILVEYFKCWWTYEKVYRSLIVAETFLDLQAYLRMTTAWILGLWAKGFEGAHKAAAGLA
ncbi:hypothetical protein EWM64_g309 [Hericium alpestre]|uniref:Rab-GAP TBC domain-containing protein n=1 Tax=Hericium alpestre TaxID=135208 RepID=A0A4Z0A9D2_9AGAM|nr:hypothetical protein EWM64_g309 [Hericium alpestre]